MIRWLLRLLGRGSRRNGGDLMVDDREIHTSPLDYRAGPSGDNQGGSGLKRKSPLVALVGTSAAIALATMIAKDESGRTVEATVSEQGELQVRHVRGPQYLEAYADIVGVWTICDGDTKGVRPGMVETPEGCVKRLERQLVAHAEPVLRCVPALARPDRENQLIASVSLAYNIGTAGFCRSTAARRFNAGDWAGGCDAFLLWNKAGGRVVRGLQLRRERERALCLKGLR
jgi:lysozyme